MLSNHRPWHDFRKTSAFRLALLLETAAMVAMLVLLALIYGLTARELNARSDRVLRREAATLATVSGNNLPAEIERLTHQSVSGLNYFGLLGRDGTLLAGNLRLGRQPAPDTIIEVSSAPGIARPLRVLALRTRSGGAILIGRDNRPLATLRLRMKQILMISALLVMPLLLGISLLLSLAPIRRVNHLRQTALVIAEGDLGARMPVSSRMDELDLFADTVNQMVVALQRTIGQVKSVTDAIAHDLRTPLSHVRSHLHRISREAQASPEQAEYLHRAIDELDLVIDRFAALLRISELETTKRTSGFAQISMSVLMQSVADLYAPLAEDRNLTLTCHLAPACPLVVGDEKLLFEAVSNLVDNAIKFTPPGGWVELAVTEASGAVLAQVSDSGPGVPQQQHQAILERFERGSATSETAGSGLGLSIVSAIVQLHKFSLDIEDNAPGLTVRITAPQAPRNAR